MCIRRVLVLLAMPMMPPSSAAQCHGALHTFGSPCNGCAGVDSCSPCEDEPAPTKPIGQRGGDDGDDGPEDDGAGAEAMATFRALLSALERIHHERNAGKKFTLNDDLALIAAHWSRLARQAASKEKPQARARRDVDRLRTLRTSARAAHAPSRRRRRARARSLR